MYRLPVGPQGYDPVGGSTDGLFPRIGRGNLDPTPGSVGGVPGSPVSTTMPVPGPGGGMPSPQFGVPGGGIAGGLPGMMPGMGEQQPDLQRGALMDALKQYIGGAGGGASGGSRGT